MPAKTVSAVTKALSKFIPPGDSMLDLLNMVLPRLYAMGYWRDLLMEDSIETDHKYFVLPDGAESLIAGMVDDYPQTLRAQWHDYKTVGLTTSGPAPLFGLVDDGFQPCIIRPDRDDETYQLRVLPIAPDTVLPTEGTVTIIFENEDEETATHEFTLAGAASMTTALASGDRMIDVKQIRFRNVWSPARFQDAPSRIMVRGIAISAGGTDINLATGRGDSVARYHRYRLNNPANETKYVNVFCKRAFETLISEADIVYLGDINAIKNGILATLSEDNGDVKRADYHWGVCRMLLEAELDSYRGAARPVIRTDPSYGFTPNLV